MPRSSARPSARPPVSRLPGRSLDPLQLIEFTRVVAEEVAGGLYPVRFSGGSAGAFPEEDGDAGERWHQRLYRDRSIDIWLITWLPTQGTDLHDHGGSAGAFTVVHGELAEAVVPTHGDRAGPVEERTHAAGAGIGFGAHYVHDVRNLSDRPAVSVHAYSPPLTTMTFYDLEGPTLTPIASLASEDPEPDLGARIAS